MLKSLKLLTDPTRLRILLLLEAEALSVADLQELLGMGQSRISTQLSQLKTAGLVNDERAGKNNVYSASIPSELSAIVSHAITEIPETTADNHGVVVVVGATKGKKPSTMIYYMSRSSGWGLIGEDHRLDF